MLFRQSHGQFLDNEVMGHRAQLFDNKVEEHTGHDGGKSNQTNTTEKAAEYIQADNSIEKIPRCTPEKWTRRSAWFSGRLLVASGAFAELSVKLWLTALFCHLNDHSSIN